MNKGIPLHIFHIYFPNLKTLMPTNVTSQVPHGGPSNRLLVAIRSNLPHILLKIVEYEPEHDLVSFHFSFLTDPFIFQSF